jgi:hypothetical protein
VPVATEHTSVDAAIAPGTPVRNVTVIVFDCCEYTLNCVAVHPAGTHTSTPFVTPEFSVSAVLEFGEFTA